ncbi:glycosyltransferase [Paenibacillus sp. FSL R5-0470]|uniref:glycosyltransferase family 2 protein n=1 Tax=Paenibacillus sp. FSL R5-0470 TaxID=2921641 RepID=UPI0030DAB882
MKDHILVQIEECINNNDIDSASALIVANEAEYKYNSLFWNLKGVLCFHVALIEEAVSCFNQALLLDGDNMDAKKNLEFSMTQQHELNLESIKKIVKILDDIIVRVKYCINNIRMGDLDLCVSSLKTIRIEIEPYREEISRLKTIIQSRFMLNVFDNILLCIDDCLNDYKYSDGKSIATLFEFTLYSLLKELREEIFYFGLIYPDTNKMEIYYQSDFATANANEYAKASLQTGKNKYPVSILVTAYNKLEYTKQCVDSILRYTQGIDYELILVNDGSIDGTREYFESVAYANKKVISFHKNTGAMIAYFIGVRAVEGKVLAAVSNDVIVTECWLENLLTCLESDPSIGMVVPTTNNISNNQTIPVPYTQIEEMQAFASRYNESNPSKWNERERLCPFLHVVPMSVFGKGICHDRLFYYGEFCDDDISLQLRLNGYRLILAKDTFCHHFGSVSLGEAQRKSNSLQISRELFKQKNKVDAWYEINNHTSHLVANIKFMKDKPTSILCIDPGFGVLPYSIKNKCNENGIKNVTLYNFSTDKHFSVISSGLFENFSTSETTNDLTSIYEGQGFEYILLCKPLEEYENVELLFKNINKLISRGGELRFLMSNLYSANNIAQLLSLQGNLFGDKAFIKFASYVAVEKLLSHAGFNSINKFAVSYQDNQTVIDSVKKMSSCLNIELSGAQEVLCGSDALLFIVES